MIAKASEQRSPKTGEHYVRLMDDDGENERHLTVAEANSLIRQMTDAVRAARTGR